MLLTMFAFAKISIAQDVMQYMNGKEKKVIYEAQAGDYVYYFKKYKKYENDVAEVSINESGLESSKLDKIEIVTIVGGG